VSESADAAIGGFKASLEHINKKLDRIESKLDDLDDRIRALEVGNEKQKDLNVRFKHHLENDIPVETREGQHAIALVKYIGGMAMSAGIGALCMRLFGG